MNERDKAILRNIIEYHTESVEQDLEHAYGDEGIEALMKAFNDCRTDRGELIRLIQLREDHRIHVDLVAEDNTKIRRLLGRSYEMISDLMPGIGGLVIDIGELNSLMISIKLQMDSSPPQPPIPSSRIFGGK